MSLEASGEAHAGTLSVLDAGWPLPTTGEALVPAVFVWLGPEKAQTLSVAMGLAGSGEVQRRISYDRRCYAAFVGEGIAAYGWVTFDEERIGEMQMRIRLKPGEAYIWDCVTLPPYRRLRLYTALLIHICTELRQEGFHRIWIGTDQENVPSQRGITAAGFRPVVDIVQTGKGGLSTALFYPRSEVPEKIVADARRALVSDLPSGHGSSRPGRPPSDERIPSSGPNRT